MTRVQDQELGAAGSLQEPRCEVRGSPALPLAPEAQCAPCALHSHARTHTHALTHVHAHPCGQAHIGVPVRS